MEIDSNSEYNLCDCLITILCCPCLAIVECINYLSAP